MKRYGVLVVFLGLSGCQLLPSEPTVTDVSDNTEAPQMVVETDCVFAIEPQDEARCELDFWQDY